MRKSKQLEKGQKFGRLTVINLHHKKEYNREKSGKGIEYIEFYLCKCKCGNDVIVKKQSVRKNMELFPENCKEIINKYLNT